ncbi:NADPH-dependent reductive aminase [Colletotrichum gloeosporioides]|uniref:NADPH-dependent reductive aminase n=1 Tax=Colletotrichum gloeosporioides TaxID=474922 RepID=A0A8H4FIA6_COLGL|nr:NADPH-dependent reductive aminase [Colletotrichum gloeosporioides]KAF3803283.1 NADPH-dependent reductive aminase [Colletotrichum gloeosporioides]
MINADVSIVGVGNIGAAMVSAWLDSGLKVTMWNRNINRPKIAKLVERGATFEPNINEAMRCSDKIVLCVSTYDDIDEVLSPILPLKGTERSITVINITTGTSKQARDMETRLKSNGIAKYFDGAIMVTPELIGTMHSSMFFSGENEAEFESISGILRPLGSSHYVAQDSGAASLWDIAALAAMYGMYSGAIVALNVLKRQRLDDVATESPSTEIPMKKIVLPLLSTLLPHLVNLSRALDKEDWDENFGNPVSMQLKGLQTILTTLGEEKVNADGLELFYRMMQRVVQDKGENAGLAIMGTYLLE